MLSPNFLKSKIPMSSGMQSIHEPQKMFRKFTYCYTSMPIYDSKFWNLGGSKISNNFLTAQKWALFDPANGQLVTYSKIQTKVCRVP